MSNMLIDWNEVWRNLREKEERVRSKDVISFWDSYAQKYYERVRKERDRYEKLAKWIVKIFKLDKDSTILEIGPGPGTYTIPFAKLVRNVTVVEPSKGMIEVLKKYAMEEKIDNIRIVQKRWEEVGIDEIEPHDLVFASYSLGVPDLKEAVEKMNSLAKRGVCIITNAGKSGWGKIYEKLYPAVFGEEYDISLDFLSFPIIYNLLYHMNIYANVRIVKKKYIIEYNSLDEAVEDWSRRLGTEKIEAVKNALLDILELSDTVRLCSEHIDAIIWWKKVEDI